MLPPRALHTKKGLNAACSLTSSAYCCAPYALGLRRSERPRVTKAIERRRAAPRLTAGNVSSRVLGIAEGFWAERTAGWLAAEDAVSPLLFVSATFDGIALYAIAKVEKPSELNEAEPSLYEVSRVR